MVDCELEELDVLLHMRADLERQCTVRARRPSISSAAAALGTIDGWGGLDHLSQGCFHVARSSRWFGGGQNFKKEFKSAIPTSLVPMHVQKRHHPPPPPVASLAAREETSSACRSHACDPRS